MFWQSGSQQPSANKTEDAGSPNSAPAPPRGGGSPGRSVLKGSWVRGTLGQAKPSYSYLKIPHRPQHLRVLGQEAPAGEESLPFRSPGTYTDSSQPWPSRRVSHSTTATGTVYRSVGQRGPQGPWLVHGGRLICRQVPLWGQGLGGQGVQSRCRSRSPPEPLPAEDGSRHRTEVLAGEGDPGRERGETWNTGGKRSNVMLLAKPGEVRAERGGWGRSGLHRAPRDGGPSQAHPAGSWSTAARGPGLGSAVGFCNSHLEAR